MDTKEATLFTAIVIAGTIITVFIVFFIISIVRQQRRILKLNRQNILAEITAMEKERARIANDLHDDLGPLMSVAKIQVDNLTVEDEKEKLQQQHALDHLDNLLFRMREISNDLMPLTLLRKGLWLSLHEFLFKIENSAGIKIHLSIEAEPSLSQQVEINIYRILQEIIHNVLKHAKATKIVLRIECKNKDILLTCIDNGKGFDYEKKLKESSGIGLQSIKNRIILMQGSILVQSKPGKGTAYQLTIPIA